MAINRALMNRQMYNMGGPSLETGAPDITLTGDMRPTYSAMRKQRLAYGGIAGLDGRKKYGIGSFLQSVKDKFVDDIIPNEIKENPVITALGGAALVNQFGIPQSIADYIGTGTGENFLGELLGNIPGVPDDLNLVIGDDRDLLGRLITGAGGDPNQIMNEIDATDYLSGGQNTVDQMLGLSDYFPPLGTTGNTITNQAKQAIENQIRQKLGLSKSAERDAAGNITYEQRRRDLNMDLAKALATGTAAGAYVESQPKDELPTDTTGINIPAIAQAARGTDADAAAEGLRFLPPQVTRLPAAEGGLMDLGGMEKDYREEGGFVPIGGKEKADDVPARLSKNEFVFTADAVRNAGNGDIDEGAQVMENVMRHLEAGGTVSPDSQGLEGAREMFQTSQRLEKRII